MKDLKHIEMISDEVMDSAAEYAQRIKGIDEHEWAHSWVSSVIVHDNGTTRINATGQCPYILLSDEDFEAKASVKGYVKRQSGGE